MAPHDSSGSERKPVILCIDDTDMILEMLDAFLTQQDYSVLTANTAESALKLFLSHDVDAVITDYQFGQFKGEEVIRSLRALKSHTPILLFSADENIPDTVHSLANRYVHKTQVRILVSELSKMLNEA